MKISDRLYMGVVHTDGDPTGGVEEVEQVAETPAPQYVTQEGLTAALTAAMTPHMEALGLIAERLAPQQRSAEDEEEFEPDQYVQRGDLERVLASRTKDVATKGDIDYLISQVGPLLAPLARTQQLERLGLQDVAEEVKGLSGPMLEELAKSPNMVTMLKNQAKQNRTEVRRMSAERTYEDEGAKAEDQEGIDRALKAAFGGQAMAAYKKKT